MILKFLKTEKVSFAVGSSKRIGLISMNEKKVISRIITSRAALCKLKRQSFAAAQHSTALRTESIRIARSYRGRWAFGPRECIEPRALWLLKKPTYKPFESNAKPLINYPAHEGHTKVILKNSPSFDNH